MKAIVDIETLENPVDEEWLAERTTEIKESFVKDHVVQRKIDEAKDAWKFTLEGARLLCIGLTGLDDAGISFKWVSAREDIGSLLRDFISILQEYAVTKLIGYNIKRFDLPILSVAMATNDIWNVKRFGRYDIIDLMEDPYQRLMKARKLDSMLKLYGIMGKVGDGSQVAQMWKADKLDGGTRVETYCLLDCQKTAELYNKLRYLYDV